MKKIVLILSLSLFIFSVTPAFSAELTAKSLTEEAAEKDSVEESIAYLENNVKKITNSAEKRSVYISIASLYELLSKYEDAQNAYVKAAGISAGNGVGMPVKSNEQIVLDAVRCALSRGDYATADSFLNSSVRNSKNENIQAYINLYSEWSALCKAETVEDTEEPVVMLSAYAKMKSMECVRPAILLTLWYITGDNKYANEIKSSYPGSIENAVVKGDAQLLPSPFWFFVPKDSDTDFSAAELSISDVKTSKAGEGNTKDTSVYNDKNAKWQVGFFQTKENAQRLYDKLKKEGFDVYITTEVRPSGTTYYQVVVREDAKGNVADRLRSAGHDCSLL